MAVRHVRVQIRDGFRRFTRMLRGGTEYAVSDPATGIELGTVWKTGSRFRQEAWSWRAFCTSTVGAGKGSASTRTDAALAMWDLACETLPELKGK